MLLLVERATGNLVSEMRLGADEFKGYLQSRLGGLRLSEAAVIRLVIDEPHFVAESTTAEVAARSGVSAPTVVRAARAVGFSGFADLKLGLAYARGSAGFFTPPPALNFASKPGDVLQTTIDGSRRALTAVEGAIDPESLERAAKQIGDARRILVIGAGTSAAVAADIAFRLNTIGIPAMNVADYMSALITARLLEKGDVAVAFSATGRTPQTITVGDAARSSGATLIAVTNQTASPLAQLADTPIIVGGESLSNQMAAAASRIAHLTVMDAVLTLVALRNPDRVHHAEKAATDIPSINS
jgi:RpiR family transcriptional regulator, carbohydrate utilization regulator